MNRLIFSRKAATTIVIYAISAYSRKSHAVSCVRTGLRPRGDRGAGRHAGQHPQYDTACQRYHGVVLAGCNVAASVAAIVKSGLMAVYFCST